MSPFMFWSRYFVTGQAEPQQFHSTPFGQCGAKLNELPATQLDKWKVAERETKNARERKRSTFKPDATLSTGQRQFRTFGVFS